MAGPSRHPTSEASGGLWKCEVRSVKSETNHLTSAVWREPTGPSQLPTKPRLVPPPSQPEFDFDRGDRLALLDALPLASGSVHDGRASVRVSGETTPIPGSDYGFGVCTQPIVDKFADHLTLYRGEDIFASAGMLPPRNTQFGISANIAAGVT